MLTDDEAVTCERGNENVQLTRNRPLSGFASTHTIYDSGCDPCKDKNKRIPSIFYEFPKKNHSRDYRFLFTEETFFGIF
jgi:hypothetical protein